jgi:predicted ABC-type ATPase
VTKPRLTIIAGANGSGKTTLTSDIKFFRENPLLDPDAIGKTLQSTMPAAFPVASARHVLTAAGKHIAKGESFAVETTLSGRSYLRMMLAARKRSFEIVLVYIGTENLETNLARIKNRVLAGGHNVPEEDVRRRYTRSFENLPTAIHAQTTPSSSITQTKKATGWSRFSARPEISGSNPYRIGPPRSYSPGVGGGQQENFSTARLVTSNLDLNIESARL